MPLITLKLPLPPTVNHYYLNRVGVVRRGAKAGKRYVGRMLTDEALAFRVNVKNAFRRQCGQVGPASGRLSLAVVVMPATRATMDLDNRCKSLQDALTWAHVIEDDAQIDDLRIVRANPVAGGACVVAISRFDPTAAGRALATLGINYLGDDQELIKCAA